MRRLAPQALLFDLGGVLVDIDFDRSFRTWSQHSRLSFEALKQKFRFDEQYECHERGEIDADEYFTHLAMSLQLTCPIHEVAAGWNAIFMGEIAATLALVKNARLSVPCYVLTNTNATHKQRWVTLYPDMVAAFDGIFASHEIGLRKPEKAAFEHVCLAMGLTPQSVLYFDDSPANIEAGCAAGLQGVLVRGPDDVARSLRAVGM
jgi:glucose-1-phosphatase